MGRCRNDLALALGHFDFCMGPVLCSISAFNLVTHFNGIADEHRLQEPDPVITQ